VSLLKNVIKKKKKKNIKKISYCYVVLGSGVVLVVLWIVLPVVMIPIGKNAS